MKTWLIIPDTHVPFEDKKAWGLMLKVAKSLSLQGVILLGDFIDCYSVSSFDKENRDITLTEEIKAGKHRLKELEALGAKEYVYLEGNHEDRMQRVAKSNPNLRDSLDLKARLALGPQWLYKKYRDMHTIGNVTFTHDLGRVGKYAVAQAKADAHTNIVIGHLHRLQYLLDGDAQGTPQLAFCPGWLGDPAKANYMKRLRMNRDWAQGFALGYLLSDKTMHVEPVPILNHRCVFRGKLYKA